MIKVTPRVYQLGSRWGIGVWGVNVFLLADDQPALIDTGFRGRAKQILKEVAQIGYSPSDIALIIITHHHTDHTGSLAALKKATQAKIAAHPADAPYIDGQSPQPGPSRPQWLSKTLARLPQLWTTTPVAVDILIKDGDELPILGGTRVLHTPGHTPGSISLFLPQERLVIAGDAINHRFKLRLPSKAFTVDMAQEIQSIKKIASLDFDFMCFGHGAPLVHNARPAVMNFVKMIESKYQK